jgi:cell division inhibitor SepF
MGFLDKVKDKLRQDPDEGAYYDDGRGYDDDYYDDGQTGQPSSDGLLGNTPRPEAESVSVYTRSGRPLRGQGSGLSQQRGMDQGSRAVSGRSDWNDDPRDDYSSDYGQDRSWDREQPSRPSYDVGQTGVIPDVTDHVTTPGDIGLTAVPRMSSGQLPPYVLKPTAYDDVQMVVRRVRTNQPVVLSFKAVKIETAKRILDFCFGLSCGIGGSVRELGDRVFVVLPAGIELSDSDVAKLTSDGVLGR